MLKMNGDIYWIYMVCTLIISINPVISLAVDLHSEEKPLFLTNGILIDGVSNESRKIHAIEINDGKIIRIHEMSEDSVQLHGYVLDCEGLYLVPGLINSHAHVSILTRSQRQALLKAGVTTVFDFGSILGDIQALSQHEQQEDLLGKPRIYYAGPVITAPGGYPIPVYGGSSALTLENEEKAYNEVSRLLDDEGCYFIKVAMTDRHPNAWPTLTTEILQNITITAHQRGAKVAVHLVSAVVLEEAISIGIDLIGHPVFGNITIEMAQQMKQQNMAYIPTHQMMYHLAQSQIPDYLTEVNKTWQSNIDLLRDIGVPILLGDDIGNEVIPISLMINEMLWLKSLGMPEMEVIKAGTSVPARIWNVSSLGSIELGKTADILGLYESPLESLGGFNSLAFGMKNGSFFHKDLEITMIESSSTRIESISMKTLSNSTQKTTGSCTWLIIIIVSIGMAHKRIKKNHNK